MEKKPLQQNAKTNDKERHNTNTTSFKDIPADIIVTILPFLELQDMGKLSLVDKRFHETITNAFTNPNMYTVYPGIFEALCKFWHENRVAFNKWFTLYRMPNIEQEEFSSEPYNEACDYIFNQLTDGSVDRNILNNALGTVFQNSTDDITQFLLPLVFNANQFALYCTFGKTTLQETSEAQINTWTTETQPSSENTHTLLFCLLFSRDVKFFNDKHRILTNILDYAEKNMNDIFEQEAIKKYGEGFIKALLQSCHLTLDAANGTKPTAEKINAIRKAFPNVPINFAGANLTGVNLMRADLTGANLTSADLRAADLTGANLTRANLTSADLRNADLTCADLTRANLTSADLRNADLTCADLTRANLTSADLREANIFRRVFYGIKINSTALLSVFIDGRNPPSATTNIWSLNNEMIDTFKLLLPHAEIKELELLMEGIKNRILVNPLDFIFGALKKAELLKLISDEIVNKRSQQQKAECEKPSKKEAISGNSQQNANTIDSTLELPKQSGNTISFNP